MGRKLTNLAEPTPVISVKKTPGSYFEGTLQNTGREVNMKKGKGMVYEFSLIDTDMGVTIKNAKGEYVEAEVEAGATVSVFAPTVLRKALEKAQVGETIRFTFLGKESGRNGGADYYNFDVEVI